jgi:hypothetical protein
MANKEFLNIFIDTRFTNLMAPMLISLGMVSDRGEELYIEVPIPNEKCTTFVLETVLPLLRMNRMPSSKWMMHIFTSINGLKLSGLLPIA